MDNNFVPPLRPKGNLVMLAGDSKSKESCRTFVFKGETHTLGNALKNVILRNPQVIFCGYSMPHPAEDQMLLRIQTVDEITAVDALKKGLQDLKSMCNITLQKFEEAVDDYKVSTTIKIEEN